MFGRRVMAKRGYRNVYRTPQTQDDGVDVVAITGPWRLWFNSNDGTDDASAGWSLKDVVTGEAAIARANPGVVSGGNLRH